MVVDFLLGLTWRWRRLLFLIAIATTVHGIVTTARDAVPRIWWHGSGFVF